MLGILGLIFIVIAAVFIYRFAKQNGRNAIVWALVALVVGFGVQIVIPIIIGIAIAVIMLSSGSTKRELEQVSMSYAYIINISFMILSVLALALIMRQVAKIPEEKSFAAPPSPPEKFD